MAQGGVLSSKWGGAGGRGDVHGIGFHLGGSLNLKRVGKQE